MAKDERLKPREPEKTRVCVFYEPELYEKVKRKARSVGLDVASFVRVASVEKAGT